MTEILSRGFPLFLAGVDGEGSAHRSSETSLLEAIEYFGEPPFV